MNNELKYRKGKPGNRIQNISLTVDEIEKIDYIIANNKYIRNRREFFETAVLELLKQYPNPTEEFLKEHRKKEIKPKEAVRNNIINCKLTPTEIAQSYFIIENNKWIHNLSQLVEISVRDLLATDIPTPEEHIEKRRYRKRNVKTKVIGIRISDDMLNDILSYMKDNEWIRTKSQFLELSITNFLKDEVGKIEEEGIFFKLSDYKNYK